jgi:hypothetical protein
MSPACEKPVEESVGMAGNTLFSGDDFPFTGLARLQADDMPLQTLQTQMNAPCHKGQDVDCDE